MLTFDRWWCKNIGIFYDLLAYPLVSPRTTHFIDLLQNKSKNREFINKIFIIITNAKDGLRKKTCTMFT